MIAAGSTAMSHTGRLPTSRALAIAAFILLLANLLAAAVAIRNRWFVTTTTSKYASLIFDELALWLGRIAAVVGFAFAVVRRWKPAAARAITRRAIETLRNRILPSLLARLPLAVATALLFFSLVSLIVLARRQPPFERPYSASGLTAAATFAGSVHGVVVQTIKASPSRPLSGKRTKSDGCSSSS